MNDTSNRRANFDLQGHIQRGDMAPWWNQGRYRFIFDRFAGRYVVMSFYHSASATPGRIALESLQAMGDLVADGKAWFFGVSRDAEDQTVRHVEQTYSSVEFLWDIDQTIHQAYGVGTNGIWIILDSMLRVVETIPFAPDGSDTRVLSDFMQALPPASDFAGFAASAPVLMLPYVFEPAFCQHLIQVYERAGGRQSGFMQEIDGRAVEVYDHEWKQREDFLITEEVLIAQIKERIARRVAPMIRQAFQFQLTRMERQLIACYSAKQEGHFGPHRDTAVRATEHRRFAMSINLNADYAGGEVSFPEYGTKKFTLPIGAALIFSSSLLHQVSKVTQGSRYVFVPFLHDEEAEKLRLANLQFLSQPS